MPLVKFLSVLCVILAAMRLRGEGRSIVDLPTCSSSDTRGRQHFHMRLHLLQQETLSINCYVGEPMDLNAPEPSNIMINCPPFVLAIFIRPVLLNLLGQCIRRLVSSYNNDLSMIECRMMC